MKKLINKLYRYEDEICTIDNLSEILNWDSLRMPKANIDYRIKQDNYLFSKRYELFKNPDYKNLLQRLSRENLPLKDKRIVEHRLDEIKKYRLKKKIDQKWHEVQVRSLNSYEKARKENNFNIWLPQFKNLVKEAINYGQAQNSNPYLTFYQEYEPNNLSLDELSDLFDYLKPKLQEIIGTTKELKLTNKPKIAKLNHFIRYDNYIHEKIKNILVNAFKIDQDRALIDSTFDTHPFQISLSRNDKRIMEFPKLGNIYYSVSTLVHELGHMMYELGINKSLDNTCLNDAPTMSMHESQSRLWEVNIGQSKEFLRFLFYSLKEDLAAVRIFPFENIYRDANDIKETPIRLESDELHYTLHIIIRFELERELFSGELNPKYLKQEWNNRYKKYLGIEPGHDKEGILQDGHWADGSFGYFPSYALANIYASMFWERLNEKVPGVQYQIADGNFDNVTKWLRQNIHKHGALYFTPEILQKTCKKDIDPDCYLTYLKTKYYNIFKI